jgi:recombinational DNA repair ATPase RecF
LLDDIDTELDILRIQRMIKYTDDKLQIFITTTKPQLIENTGKEVFLIEIESGNVKNLKKIN